MRILILCFEYPPIGGGGGVGAQQYAEAWAAKGHDVAVLTSRAKGLPSRERVDGVDLIRVLTLGRRDRATSTFFSMLCYNFFGLLYVLTHLGALRRYEVINTHFSIPTGPLAHIAARLLRRPNVLTIIGGDIYDPSKSSSPHRSSFLRRVNRWVINGADRVIAISSDTKRRAEEHYGIVRPVTVINYGYTPTELEGDDDATEDVELDKFNLISVGRLVSRKGFEYLIRALPALPDDVALLLVGDGPLAGELSSLARELGVQDRVHMLGYRTREYIHHLLRRADCYVLSSLHEGLGIVVQEAMDAGLPVVATNNGGQVDLLSYPRNGILVEIENAEALTSAIRSLYDDRDMAVMMGRNNRADIDNYHIDTNCEHYLAVFDEVTARPPAEANSEAA